MIAPLLVLALAAPPATLRVDYVHTGTATEERVAFDRVVREGPWPGPLDRTTDDTNLGRYRFLVLDTATQAVLYSRGFASVYGEWETTPEAKERARAFHESVRFPEPSHPVQVVIQKRDREGLFHEIASLRVDPRDPAVDRSPLPAREVWSVLRSGEPQDKVDLLLLGDGYTAAEMETFHADARRLADTLFSTSPFRERKADFNVWAVDTPAAESGVSRPSDGVWRRSPLGASYDAFGSERYVLVLDNRTLRDVAASAPYEFLVVLVNDRKYGGGGIHNLYATAAARSAWAPYLFVHEFGHHFAALADEYYTSATAYESSPERPEPWEPNVTADARVAKWGDLVTAGTPLPTPWPKAEFEAAQKEIQARRRALRAERRPEEEMDALFREEKALTTKLLGSSPHAGKVGAFEGANYEATGYYRGFSDCIMFTRDEGGFCPVCRRAVERVIDLYAPRRR